MNSKNDGKLAAKTGEKKAVKSKKTVDTEQQVQSLVDTPPKQSDVRPGATISVRTFWLRT